MQRLRNLNQVLIIHLTCNYGYLDYLHYHEKKGVKQKNLILYGESLGTAIAVEVAQNKNLAGVILESPFTSMVELSQQYYPLLPVKFLLKDKYETIKKIRNVNSPLLVLHGKLDNIVPFSMGERLFNKANEPKFKYFVQNDDHMMRYDQKLLDEITKFISYINK